MHKSQLGEEAKHAYLGQWSIRSFQDRVKEKLQLAFSTTRHSSQKFGIESNSNFQEPFHCYIGWRQLIFSHESLGPSSAAGSCEFKPLASGQQDSNSASISVCQWKFWLQHDATSTIGMCSWNTQKHKQAQDMGPTLTQWLVPWDVGRALPLPWNFLQEDTQWKDIWHCFFTIFFDICT